VIGDVPPAELGAPGACGRAVASDSDEAVLPERERTREAVPDADAEAGADPGADEEGRTMEEEGVEDADAAARERSAERMCL
jgi:hypothetical protein